MPRDPLPSDDLAVCRHCGSLRSAADPEGFCCLGCRTAYQVIAGAGLGSFYDRLTTRAGQRPLKPDQRDHRQATLSVQEEDHGICSLSLMVDGLHCAACVWLIETLLSREPDILTARVNFTTRRLRLRWRGPRDRAVGLIGRVEGLGFRLVPFDPAALKDHTDATGRDLLRCLAIAGFAASNVMLLSVAVWAGHAGRMGGATRDLLHWLSALIAMPAILVAGQPFYRPAWRALRHGSSCMELPISIGLILATAMSLSETLRHGPYAYFDSATTLLFFLLIGRVLDHRARGQTRLAAAHLLSLGMAGAQRLTRSGGIETVPSASLVEGDHIRVAAGERIGADGRVIEGNSDIDGSLVTGESVPQTVSAGSLVFGGMLNLSGPLTLSVTAAGESSLLARIVRLMEAAETGRAAYRRLADRLSRLYAPVVHSAALATFLFWLLIADSPWQVALLRAVAVLIITCPCALALAIPAVQVVASGALLRRGILLKSATALERLALVDHVVFDKTGTLTLGQPRLRDDPAREPAMLGLAAAIAGNSRHPLSRALLAACPTASLRGDVVDLPGQGLQAGPFRLGSRSWLGLGDDDSSDAELWLAGPAQKPVRFAFEEQLRPETLAVLAGLRADGCRLSLISGDRPAAVRRLAEACGILDWQAGLDPAGKVGRLAAYRARGDRVLMVGDGLNDAPALAASDVSLSPASAADIAQNAADVVFQGDSLQPVRLLLRVARHARRVVRQNLAFALLYNIAAIPLAVSGAVTPPLAAALMSSSSILVVLNALRLRRATEADA